MKPLALGLVVSVALVVGEAHAHVIVDFTFEDDTVGSMPAGWTETSGYDGRQVIAYVTDTTAGAGNKSFYMDDWASHSQLSFRTSFPSRSSGVYHLSGMARVEQDDVGIWPFGLIGWGNRRYNVLEFGDTGTIAYVDGRGNRVDSGVAYQTGQWYAIDYLIDMDARLWGFSIEDSHGGSVLSASNLGFDTNTGTSFDRIRSLGALGSDTGEWYIDNVRLQEVPIPEPSTIGVWSLLAAFGIFGWRRRR